MTTKVRFLHPFVYADTVGMVNYYVKVDRAVANMYGYLNDALAAELESLGLVESIEEEEE